MEKINISIIIPTWNRSHLVRALLKSLQEDRGCYKYGNTEILVIDSSKGAEKEAIVSACTDHGAVYMQGEDNVRKKRNKGIDNAMYEYVLFIDSDVTVEKGLLNAHAETLSGYADNDKLAGSFGLTEFVGERKFWWKILELTTFIDSFSFANKYPYVSWTIGNNVAFRKEVLLEIGKFEENFPYKLGGDDLDMTYRVTKAGYLIKTTPKAKTYHTRATWSCWNAVNDRSKRWGAMEYFILKRHPELAMRRLPMTGDVSVFMLLLFGAAGILKHSLIPVLFLGIWFLLLYSMLYAFYVRQNGPVNLFYWTIAMMLQGKYRFHRFAMSLKQRDLSLAFKGQFFGIYHIQNDYRINAKKVWIYCTSFMLICLVMMCYHVIAG